MWNQAKSIVLSIFCTRLFMLLVVAAVFLAPYITRWYFGSGGVEQTHLAFRVTIYICALPAIFLLLLLDRLLRNIRKNAIFEELNVKLLRGISWLCIVLGVITLTGGFFYSSFFLVAAAAAFCGLIVRVVKNVFEHAIELKEENDYTI